MKYTIEQRDRIKKAITIEDRKKLKNAFGDIQARQIANGLKSVSNRRAIVIASLLGKPKLVRLLLPEVFAKSV